MTLSHRSDLGTVSKPDAHTGVLAPLLRHPPTTEVETRPLATSPANHNFRIVAAHKAYESTLSQQGKKSGKVPTAGIEPRFPGQAFCLLPTEPMRLRC